MLAIQEPYSLLASELGQLRPLDTDHAGFPGQRRLGIGNDSVEIVIRFPLLVLCTVFAGVPEFGAISDSNFKQPKRYAPAFSRRRVHRIPPHVCDDREPPLGARPEAYRFDLGRAGTEKFFESGLDN